MFDEQTGRWSKSGRRMFTPRARFIEDLSDEEGKSESKEREVKELTEEDEEEAELRNKSIEELKEISRGLKVKPPKVVGGERTKDMWILAILRSQNKPDLEKFKKFIQEIVDKSEKTRPERFTEEVVKSVKDNKKFIINNLVYVLSFPNVVKQLFSDKAIKDMGSNLKKGAEKIYKKLSEKDSFSRRDFNTLNDAMTFVRKQGKYDEEDEKEEEEMKRAFSRGKSKGTKFLQRYLKARTLDASNVVDKWKDPWRKQELKDIFHRKTAESLERQQEISNMFRRVERVTGESYKDFVNGIIPALTMKKIKECEENIILDDWNLIPLASRVKAVKDMENEIEETTEKNIKKKMDFYEKLFHNEREGKTYSMGKNIKFFLKRFKEDFAKKKIPLEEMDFINNYKRMTNEEQDWIRQYLFDRYGEEYISGVRKERLTEQMKKREVPEGIRKIFEEFQEASRQERRDVERERKAREGRMRSERIREQEEAQEMAQLAAGAAAEAEE